MILYHLDRTNTFPSDPSKQLISLSEVNNTPEAKRFFKSMYPNGINNVGKRYLNPFDEDLSDLTPAIKTYNNSRVYTIEYVFEMVRLLDFPHLPSRFTSLFACENASNIKLWYDSLNNTSNAIVKKIEVPEGNFICCDAGWRDAPFNLISDDKTERPIFNPFSYHVLAKKYWNGQFTSSPKPEFLCQLPVSVLDSEPVSDFLDRLVH